MLSAPKSVSFCSDFILNGQESRGGGGRPLSYGWFVSVEPDADSISDPYQPENYAACDTDETVVDSSGATIDCPPWVLRLQTTLRSLPPSQALLRTISMARADVQRSSCRDGAPGNAGTCATDGLHVCFPTAEAECDIRPGYRYTWKLVTYSWFFLEGEQVSIIDGKEKSFTCGDSAVPLDLWYRPRNFITCPATSYFRDTDPICNNPLQVCEPWAAASTVVSRKPMQELKIQGPTVLNLPMPEVNVRLQGQVDTRSLLACFTEHEEAGAIDKRNFDLLEGKGTPEQLSAVLQSEWRVIRATGPSTGIDVCRSSFAPCPPETVPYPCEESLANVPSRRSLVLDVPVGLFEANGTYHMALDSRMVGADAICTRHVCLFAAPHLTADALP